MAILTKKEFSEKCFLKTKALSVYIKRGKVKVNEDGTLDDGDPLNKMFIEHQVKLQKERKPMEDKPEVAHTEQADSVIPNSEPKEEEKPAKKEKNTPKNQRNGSWVDEKIRLDAEKTQIDIEHKQQQLLLLRMEEEKKLGKLIPTDVVKSLFGQHFKSVTTSFKQSLDIISMEFAKKAKLNRNEQADLRGQMITALNRAIDDGINSSKKSLKAIVEEYSQAKAKS